MPMSTVSANNSLRDRLKVLFGVDPRSMAVFRMAVAFVLLYDLVTRAVDLRAMVTDDGIATVATVAARMRGSWSWSIHLLDGSFAFQAVLFGLAAVLAVALLVGYRTRLVTVGSWLLLVSLQVRTPYLTTGGDVLLAVSLFWGMFLPLGKRWSLDAASQPSPLDHGDSIFSVATAALLLQVFVMYLFTGLYKLNTVWLSGDALALTLVDDMIVRPLGRMLVDVPLPLKILTCATLALELLGPLMLFSPWYTRRMRLAALIGFYGLHVGIQLTMKILIFSFASMAALLLFVPGWCWELHGLRVLAGKLDRLTARQNHRASNRVAGGSRKALPGWILRLATVAGLCCIGYVLFYNVLRLSRGGRWPAAFVAAHHPAELLAMGQQWNMFDDPERLNNRFVALARLRNNSQVDLLRDSPIYNHSLRPTYAGSYPTERWMVVFRYAPLPENTAFRPGLVDYLRRRWDEKHSPDESVVELELLMYPAVARESAAETVPPVSLAYLDTRAEGPMRLGYRHGDWINRHDNGGKASEGEYQWGVEHGDWTYWYADGGKEMEGAFRFGKMHGEWTFWYPDGGTSRAIFRNDELVEQLHTDQPDSESARRDGARMNVDFADGGIRGMPAD